MARIIILGNKYSDELSTRLKAELVEVPDLYANDLGSINDFVVCRLKSKFDVLIIDVDNIQRTDVALALGLYLRLSFAELGTNSLVPIIIASDKRIKSFLHIPNCSQLLLTKSVYFQSRTEIDTQNVLPLDANKYKTDFLDFINIQSGPKVGRHSLANQWGASALSRMVSANEVLQNDSLINAQKTLYFKYVFAKTTDNIEPYLNPSKDKETPKKLPSKVNANGKRILLIDDEADKGWSTVLDTMLVGNKLFDVIKDRVPNYDSLSADSRNKIESNIYDLIFLDLRMNGDAEENNLEPEKFSGMDILKKIKSRNKGTQVVIFTASNKAWNLKALLDAGADGYYTKESPELLFPYEVSYGNYVALQKTINRCFEREYLQRIYPKIEQLKKLVKQYNYFGDETDVMLGNIDVSFDLMSKSNEADEYNAYAYLQLFLVIEEYTNLSSVIDVTGDDLYLNKGTERYRILKDKVQTNSGKYKYQAAISFNAGHYALTKGVYESRFVDTNFRVSSLLIYKFGECTSGVRNWTTIYTIRNSKAAHPKSEMVYNSEINQILDFMIFFFDENNANWRPISDAFHERSIDDGITLLQEKYGNL